MCVVDMGDHEERERPAEGDVLVSGYIMEAHAHVVLGVTGDNIEADAYPNAPPQATGYDIALRNKLARCWHFTSVTASCSF